MSKRNIGQEILKGILEIKSHKAGEKNLHTHKMLGKLYIKICPTCNSDKIQLVIKDITRKYKGQPYTVPAVEFYECSNCGEKVFDSAAVQKIEAHSPAYQHEQALAEI